MNEVLWRPTEAQIQASPMDAFRRQINRRHGVHLDDYHDLHRWSIEQRETFANDPLNLQATDGPTNQSKSDRGPGDWMPPDTSYACTYAARFIEILATYQLTINTTDRSALATQLTSCSA